MWLSASLRALNAHKLRSLLTILGFAFGVASVIAAVAIGAGAQAEIENRIRSLGANLLLVSPGTARNGALTLGTGSRPSLTLGDSAAMAREIAGLEAVAPMVFGRVRMVRGARNWSTVVQGVTPAYFIAREWRLAQGRALAQDDVDQARRVAVIGTSAAQRLGLQNRAVGAIVRIGETPFTIVGQLAEKGQSPDGRDQDDTVLVPITTAKNRVLDAGPAQFNAVQMVVVKVGESSQIAGVEDQLDTLLRQRHAIGYGQDPDFRIRALSSLHATRADTSRILTLLLVGIGSVALLVSALNVANLMILAVRERTREIGILGALGASPMDIHRQFLGEAAVLSIFGSTLGVGLGVVAAHAVAAFGHWPVAIRADLCLMAAVSAIAVGLAAGLYPAWRAAAIDPVAALRFE